jgi:hypothetical protein
MFPPTVFALYEKLNTMNNCIVPFIDKEFSIKRESFLNPRFRRSMHVPKTCDQITGIRTHTKVNTLYFI